MAAGDVHVIGKYMHYLAGATGPVDWDADIIRMALAKATLTPSIDATDPCWGAGGTENYSTDEVTAGGSYAAGGNTATATLTFATHIASLKITSPMTWAANAANPTIARWAIVYDDTVAKKPVLCYIDLGGVTSLVPGLQLNINGVSSGAQPLMTGTSS